MLPATTFGSSDFSEPPRSATKLVNAQSPWLPGVSPTAMKSSQPPRWAASDRSCAVSVATTVKLPAPSVTAWPTSGRLIAASWRGHA
jgi:hypothetical protein